MLPVLMWAKLEWNLIIFLETPFPPSPPPPPESARGPLEVPTLGTTLLDMNGTPRGAKSLQWKCTIILQQIWLFFYYLCDTLASWGGKKQGGREEWQERRGRERICFWHGGEGGHVTFIPPTSFFSSSLPRVLIINEDNSLVSLWVILSGALVSQNSHRLD